MADLEIWFFFNHTFFEYLEYSEIKNCFSMRHYYQKKTQAPLLCEWTVIRLELITDLKEHYLINLHIWFLKDPIVDMVNRFLQCCEYEIPLMICMKTSVYPLVHSHNSFLFLLLSVWQLFILKKYVALCLFFFYNSKIYANITP